MLPIAQIFGVPIAIGDCAKKIEFAQMINEDGISAGAIRNVPPFLFEIIFVIEIERIAVGSGVLRLNGGVEKQE